jgi:hypothetical protein
MPLRITPSKRPLPVGKRSSLRKKSYEVEPIPGPKVYPSREYPVPVRPPPLSDVEAASFQTSRPQIHPESAADTSLVLSDPMQPPPDVALDPKESINPSWQIATSRRSARTRHRVQPVISSRTVVMYDDVMNDPLPYSCQHLVEHSKFRSTVLNKIFKISNFEVFFQLEIQIVSHKTSLFPNTRLVSLNHSFFPFNRF